MATTKIWAIKDSVKRVIEYARNPEKTEYNDLSRELHYIEDGKKTEWTLDEKVYLVSSINCTGDPYEAMMKVRDHFGDRGSILAHHAYQSFKPGEVTPESGIVVLSHIFMYAVNDLLEFFAHRAIFGFIDVFVFHFLFSFSKYFTPNRPFNCAPLNHYIILLFLTLSIGFSKKYSNSKRNEARNRTFDGREFFLYNGATPIKKRPKYVQNAERSYL